MARIEINQGGIAHFALDVDGDWARTSTPHLLVISDYDAQDRLIGVTFAGPLASIAVKDGVAAALRHAVSPEITDRITGADAAVDTDELNRVEAAIYDSVGVAAAGA